MPLPLGIALLLVLIGGVSMLGGVYKSISDLPDVDPANQGGGFSRTYDYVFQQVSKSTGVPFALLKAHAIIESSLNPSAFRDESNGRADRKGWASRGLMQVLWWPGSERWKQFGFPDSTLGPNGEYMFDPKTNVTMAAKLIASNFRQAKGDVRDTINLYNAGTTEKVRPAPGNYVDKVLTKYETICGKEIA